MKRDKGEALKKHEGKGRGGEISAPCIYFPSPGPDNTARVLEIVVRRAEELDVESIVFPTTSGATGFQAAGLIERRNLVAVSHSTGFIRPDHQQLDPESRMKLEKAGVRVLTCQHALGGVGRAVRRKLGTYELDEIIAHTLRTFGEGTKVAVEIALMAADAGLIRTTEPCISLGGTSGGVDTALVLKPAHAQNFFDLRILEFLARPRMY